MFHEPSPGEPTSFRQVHELFRVQQLVSQAAEERLCKAALPRGARLNVKHLQSRLLAVTLDCLGNELRAVVGAQFCPDGDGRKGNRLPVAIPAIVQKVDDAMNRLDSPIAALARDITKVGVGLIVENVLPVDELFAIRVEDEDNTACVLAVSLWCKPIGPFYPTGFQAVDSVNSLS